VARGRCLVCSPRAHGRGIAICTNPPTGARRTSIRTMSETMTVTAAKAHLSELVAAVATTQDHVEITRNGEPAAVLVSHAEMVALRETIAILSDPMAVEDIRQGEADVLAGRRVNAEELRGAMLSRRPTTA